MAGQKTCSATIKEDMQPSLPREAVLIPRNSIFSYSTRSPKATISFDLSFMAGEGAGTQLAYRSECPTSTILHQKSSPCTDQADIKEQLNALFPPLAKEGLKRERTRVNMIANRPNRHQLPR